MTIGPLQAKRTLFGPTSRRTGSTCSTSSHSTGLRVGDMIRVSRASKPPGVGVLRGHACDLDRGGLAGCLLSVESVRSGARRPSVGSRDTAGTMSRGERGDLKANFDDASRGLDGWMEQFADDVEYRAPEGFSRRRRLRSTGRRPCGHGSSNGSTRSRNSGSRRWSSSTRARTRWSWSSGSAGAPRSAASKRNRPKRWSPRFATGRSRADREFMTRREALEAAGLSE